MTNTPLKLPRRENTRKWDAIWPTLGEADLVNAHTPVNFEVAFSQGWWTITRDRKLFERYASRDEAIRSVKRAMQEIFSIGTSAGWRLLPCAV